MAMSSAETMRSSAASGSDGSAGSAGAASSGSRSFEIKIQRIDGSSQRVEVQPDMTGLQLKELISQKLGVSMDQRLICRGRAIKDDDLLGSHVTDSGQIVHMVQRPPPAPSASSSTPSQPSGGPHCPVCLCAVLETGAGAETAMWYPCCRAATHLQCLVQCAHLHGTCPNCRTPIRETFTPQMLEMACSEAGIPSVPPPVTPRETTHTFIRDYVPTPGVMTGLPFLGQSQVFHIAVPDFIAGGSHGFAPAPPGPPGPVGPGPPGPGSFGVIGPAVLERPMPGPCRGPEPGAPRPTMGPPQPAMAAMRGIPLVPGTFPHPVPPHYAPPPAPFHGAPAAVPPHFPPPMPTPMHVVLQGFPPQGLAQVIPQLLGAAVDAVPPPPRAPPVPFAGPRHPEALPWRDLRRLHSHLTVALGRSSGYRPANLPPDGLTPEAEMKAFLTSLHAATSQLGVAVSDLIQNSESLTNNGPPTRQQTQFNLVLGSASRVFRALSNAMSSSASSASAATGRPETPRQAPPVPDTEVANALAPAALPYGLQPWELMATCWSEVIPGVLCPEHLTRLYAYALLQDVIATASPGFNWETAETYPHLASLLRL